MNRERSCAASGKRRCAFSPRRLRTPSISFAILRTTAIISSQGTRERKKEAELYRIMGHENVKKTKKRTDSECANTHTEASPPPLFSTLLVYAYEAGREGVMISGNGSLLLARFLRPIMFRTVVAARLLLLERASQLRGGAIPSFDCGNDRLRRLARSLARFHRPLALAAAAAMRGAIPATRVP